MDDQNTVPVEVNGKTFTKVDAITLLNTLEDVVNRASIGEGFVQFESEDNKVKYILTTKK